MTSNTDSGSGRARRGQNQASPSADRADIPADDSIDFRHKTPADGAAEAEPRSDSSVLTWEELVGPAAGDQVVLTGDSAVDAADPESDHDLLHDALTGETPPTGVLPRTQSHPEINMDVPAEAAGNGSRAVPSPSSRTFSRAEPFEDDDDAISISAEGDAASNSSILSALYRGPDSAIRSDLFGEGSRVDLLSHLKPKRGASGKMPRTDALAAAPPPTHSLDDDESLLQADLVSDDESSTVDLGSRPAVDLPFPLGVDSSVGSSVVNAGGPHHPRGSSEDSGSVDLMAGGSEFNLRRHPGLSSAGSAVLEPSGHTLPATTPIASAGASPWPWVGGAGIGAAAALLAMVGYYFTVLAPRMASRPVVDAAALAARPTPGADPAALAAANKRYDDLTAQLAAAGLTADRLGEVKKKLDEAAAARRQAQELEGKLETAAAQAASATAEQAKLRDALAAAESEKQRFTALLETIRKAQLDPEALPAEIKKLADARRQAEQSARDAADRLAALQAEMKQAAAKVQSAEERLAAVQAEELRRRQSQAQFLRQLNERLTSANLVAGGARPDELLAAVDVALSRRTESPAGIDSLQAERLFAAGVRAYRDRNWAQAESLLAAAAKLGERDARLLYLLGLARHQLGKADAAADFRAAAALELQHLPGPNEVSEFLARFPSADRAAVNQYRP